MCELIPIGPYDFSNHPGPIDSILRTPDDGKHHLSPVYDFVTPIVHSSVGRVRRFSGKG